MCEGCWTESSRRKESEMKVVFGTYVKPQCHRDFLTRCFSRRDDGRTIPTDLILLRHAGSSLKWRSVMKERSGLRTAREDDEICAVDDPNTAVCR